MPSKHEKVYHKSKKDKTTYRKQIEKWEHNIQEQLPILSKSEAYVLALWSFAMVIIRSCAITTVSFFLASLLKTQKESLDTKQNSWRQRLREFCYDSDDKRGQKRKELNVECCFPYLMKWIWWNYNQLAIALDATTLEFRFTILAVSVVYRGCAIPVAWTITKGNEKGEWNPHWLRMIGAVKESIPNNYKVFVMTDSGLYSPKIYNACLYGMRAWIEHGFRVIKSGFWEWNRTKMDAPERASRYWLVISIGMIWISSVGGEVDESIPCSTVPDIIGEGHDIKIEKRQISICRLGWIKILANLIRHDGLPFGKFIPEPIVEVSKSLAIQRSLRKQKSKTYPCQLLRGDKGVC